ncbi:serine hydrolase [Emcibacter sp. SYSU 3D8]|uniref:serine hydrolase domain-containing protein n=1 Tax=Emcibacter sp. SYSU 3D8 TaxID=3133969 RepID=UPI0031FF0484
MRLLAAVLILMLAGAGPAQALTPLPPQRDDVPWPAMDWPEGPPQPDVDTATLDGLLRRAWAESETVPGLRAVIIIHRGVLVAEGYAPGFDRNRKFLSQSVAKTVLGALAGIAVGGGTLDLDGPAPVPAWADPGDPRHAISIRNLLRMNDGLDFNEAYFNPFTSDVLPMLFGRARGDMAGFAASRPLKTPPGTRWSYSSGTANLLSGIVRDAAGGTREAYLAFMKRELFDPIGMASAEPEFDAAGTFVGSSWLHATARDWARFGLLMLRGGVWDGRRILPEGWVDFMRTPQPDGDYGAMTWLNTRQPMRLPTIPADAFMASGHRGQVIAMIPSKDLVVVRFGRTGYARYEALYNWLGQVMAAFPDVSQSGVNP